MIIPIQCNQNPMPTQRREVELGQRLAHKYTKERLIPKEEAEAEYGGTPFDERLEDEQAELFFKFHSLEAELGDLNGTIFMFEHEEEEKEKGREAADEPQYSIRVLNGRRIRIPMPSGEPSGTYKKKSIEKAQERREEVKQEMANMGTIPGFSEAVEKKMLRTFFLMKVAREAEQLRTRNAEIEATVDLINQLAIKSKAGAVRGADRKRLDLLEKELDENKTKIEEIDNYEGGHTVKRFLQIKEYAETANKGRMVEFPSAKAVVDEGLDHMRDHQPFLLAGHLGSGKTELARHMAKIFMIENGVDYDPEEEQNFDELYNRLEPEFFSGSDEASIYDLVGKLRLVGKDASDPMKIAQRTKDLSTALLNIGINISNNEIAKILTGKSDVTETIFSYGPLGRAIRDGRPIIIDEINLVPPEILGRLNQVMLRGVGSTERLQENGEEPLEIKPGFVVLATCNLGTQYEGTREVNAAFKSRWVAKEVGYPNIEETYDLMLATLVRKDFVRMPPDFPPESFEQLVDLAVATREIQEIFSGQTENQRFMAMSSGVSPEKSQLEKAVVSTRDLMKKIISVWKKNNFRESLDNIISRNILAAEVWSKDDQKFMTEIFIRRGFFADWSEKDFKKTGIYSVSQRELDALQAQIDTEEYKNANKAFDEIREKASERASLVRDELLIGTKAQHSSAEKRLPD